MSVGIDVRQMLSKASVSTALMGTGSIELLDPVLTDDVLANDARSGQVEGDKFSSSPGENPLPVRVLDFRSIRHPHAMRHGVRGQHLIVILMPSFPRYFGCCPLSF